MATAVGATRLEDAELINRQVAHIISSRCISYTLHIHDAHVLHHAACSDSVQAQSHGGCNTLQVVMVVGAVVKTLNRLYDRVRMTQLQPHGGNEQNIC